MARWSEVDITLGPTMATFRMRVATKDDLQVTFAITEDAMRSYLEEAGRIWNTDRQLQAHKENFTPGTDQVILVEDEIAGFLAVEDLPPYVWLMKLFLLQRFRGQGIGSQVLQAVLQAAKIQDKPVKLQVLRVNKRAQALYVRHGFHVTEENTTILQMASGA